MHFGQEQVRQGRDRLVAFQGQVRTPLEVIEAQQELYPAELALAQNRLNRLVAVIQLYRALGGGWHLRDDEWSAGQYLGPRK